MKEKVYLVMCISDNLAEFIEDQCITDGYCAICSTREKAEEYIKNWRPTDDDAIVTDDVSEINHLTDEEVEVDDKYLRHVFVKKGKYYKNLHSFYIVEEEVM